MKKISFEIPDFDERGVSPVIGVILMVAITVILAAVIASFVLGFGDSVSENVQAGADISTSNGDASVTWISEGNAENLSVTAGSSNSVNITDVGQSVSITYNSSMNTTADQTNQRITLGSSSSQTVQVTVTAVGSGGSRTVVTQEEVTLDDDDNA
jgi:flagellin-like protein